jgi:hypothetical protein
MACRAVGLSCRLAQNGKLGDIEADWEEWQLDQMLVQVRTRTAAALKEQGKAATGFGGALICSTRLRRGRGEVQEADDSPNEEPRRVSDNSTWQFSWCAGRACC